MQIKIDLYDNNGFPFLKILFPFSLGIILAFKSDFNGFELPFILIISAALSFFIANLKPIKFNFGLGITYFIAWFVFGWSITTEFKFIPSTINFSKKNQPGIFQGTVIGCPILKGKSTKIEVQLSSVQYRNYNYFTFDKTIIYHRDTSIKLFHGDKIAFLAFLNPIDPPKNPGTFNYKEFLSYNKINYQGIVNFGDLKLLKQGFEYNPYRIALKTQLKIVELNKKALGNNQESALASALLVGYKYDISNELNWAYANTGAVHVLAVSGLHVSLIFSLLSILFLKTKLIRSNTANLCIIITTIWIYAFITGLSPSVCRSALMISLISLAQIQKTQHNIINMICASAVFILLIKPTFLFEIGFQLSYLAVLGIILINPLIEPFIKTKYYILKKIWQTTSLSIAAQTSTFPLSLLIFHQFPNYFIFSNLLVIPLTSIILVYNIVMVSLLPISDFFLKLGTPLFYLIKFTNQIVFYIEKIPNAITEGITITTLQTLVLYASMFFFLLAVRFKNKVSLFVFLISISIVTLYYNINNLYVLSTPKTILYSNQKKIVIGTRNGNDFQLIGDSIAINNKSNYKFNLQGFIWESKAKNIKRTFLNSSNNYLIKINDKLIFILNTSTSIFPTSDIVISNNKILFKTKKYKLNTKQVITVNNLNNSLAHQFQKQKILYRSNTKKYIEL